MAAGTASRIAHLLALMNNGDDIRPGSAGAVSAISHPQGARALVAAAVALLGLSARITQHA